MAEVETKPELDDAVIKADRYSKIAALFVACGMFGAALLLTDNLQFNTTVAAIAAIGARFYIPYQAVQSLTDADHVSLQEHPMGGNYHHGALGLTLVLVSVVALGTMILTESYYVALGVSVTFTVLSYFALRSLLP